MEDTVRKKGIIWLGFLLFLLWSMVVLGGTTRLTGSGLSMVEWNPIMGIIPPISHKQWIDSFNKYKLFPEYSSYNFLMTLGEFKFIYLMEYSHRILGRLIGICYFIPFCFM